MIDNDKICCRFLKIFEDIVNELNEEDIDKEDISRISDDLDGDGEDKRKERESCDTDSDVTLEQAKDVSNTAEPAPSLSEPSPTSLTTYYQSQPPATSLSNQDVILEAL